MKESILKYASNTYSQNGEDGILDQIIKRLHVAGLIDLNHGTCCEIGAHDGIFCSNTRKLREYGWYGLLIEGDRAKWDTLLKNATKNSNSVCAYVSEKNVNDLLFHLNFSLLSIDTDGPCYSIWKAYEGKPDIVIIEINSSLDPDKDFYSPDKGANFSIMNKLAEEKGYFLLCHTGNCIYVLNKYKYLFPDADTTFDRRWLC